MPYSQPRLLLIEDEPAHAMLVRLRVEAFQPPGRIIEEAATLADAVALLRDVDPSNFDAILMDLGLPDGHGVDAVRTIVHAAAGVPVIVLTGSDDATIGPEAVAAGAQDYLVKADTDGPELDRAVRYARMRQRAIDRLARANRDIEQLVYSVTHDLKNPLMIAKGFLDLVLERHEDSLPQDVIDALHRIERQHVRMNDLIKDMLHYARALHGDISVTPNDLGRMIQQVLHDHGLADRLEVEVDELPKVLADTALLRQAVANILVNAAKYRHPDRPARLRVTAESVASGTRLRFADNGQGIPPQRREEMFSMFARGHGASVDGTGIGLSIVRLAIERHDGSVHLADGIDGGLAVVITLPDARVLEATP